MGVSEILQKLPSGGFLKATQEKPAAMSGEKRSALIRKGNELFNKGKVALAQRIFVTTRYADGLVRIGDWYVRQNRPLDALKAYWIAPRRDKAAVLIERMSCVISEWIREEGETRRP
jgi:hypothetical protein